MMHQRWFHARKGVIQRALGSQSRCVQSCVDDLCRVQADLLAWLDIIATRCWRAMFGTTACPTGERKLQTLVGEPTPHVGIGAF
jgi:hypothetical protein